MSETKKRIIKLLSMLLCTILLAGCGNTASDVPQITKEIDEAMNEEDSGTETEPLQEENAIPDDGIITKSQMETIAGKKGNYNFNGETEDGIAYKWTYSGEKIQNPEEQALLVKVSAQELDDVKKAANDAPYAMAVTLQDMSLAAPATLAVTLNEKWDADKVLYCTLQDGKLAKLDDADISDVENEKSCISFDVTMTGDTFYLVGGSSTGSKDENKEEAKAQNSEAAQKDNTSEAPEETGEEMQEETQEETQEESDQDEALTCTISIDCATILDNWDDLNESKAEFVPSDGWILYPSEVEFTQGETVFDVLKRVCNDAGIHMSSRYTPLYGSYYIEGMNQLYEFDCGTSSGWMYNVNGWYPNYGCSSYTVEDGDVIEWRFTCNREDGVGGNMGGLS